MTIDSWNSCGVRTCLLYPGNIKANGQNSERWQTWTATLWLLSGVTAFTTVFIFFLLPETLYTNILLRRAQRLRRQTGDPAYQSQAELDTPGANLAVRIVRQTVDDFKLSCTDPVILFVNMHTMLIYGILYLWFEFFPFGESNSILWPYLPANYSLLIVFDGIYHFTAIQQGRKSLAKASLIYSNLISSCIFWYSRRRRSVRHCIRAVAIFFIPATGHKFRYHCGA